jgi:CheY-like chemotaxis protein/nitrogen-specific signal transduction histidine kinase
MMALYYAKIVSSQSKLEHEIEVHRATARELQRATEEAQRTTRAKAEFLAKMSHELRTPLNAIIGFSEILLEDVAGDEQKAEDLGKINGAGKRLLHLINDLLDLSKLEAGKMEVYPEPFELEAFLDAIVAEWRMPIEESGNELRVDRSGPLGAVVNEAARLRQAVNHLLGNAAKFTRNGRITLRVSHAQGEVRLAVEDTGAGIEADRFGTLFETFGSRDDETSSKYGEDPGLGLPLTHRLCTLMGGTLSVDSVVGRGSCFTIRIPSNLRVQATAEELTDTDAAVAPGRDRQARPILVIDDDQHVLDLLERMLARQGLWPVLSADAAEGIARARQLNPAVIILDIEMPSFDGWQALREIRDDPLLRSCPVILLTVNDDFARGRTLGADAHLLKPIDREALFRCIGRLDPLLVGTDSLEPVPAE